MLGAAAAMGTKFPEVLAVTTEVPRSPLEDCNTTLDEADTVPLVAETLGADAANAGWDVCWN